MPRQRNYLVDLRSASPAKVHIPYIISQAVMGVPASSCCQQQDDVPAEAVKSERLEIEAGPHTRDGNEASDNMSEQGMAHAPSVIEAISLRVDREVVRGIPVTRTLRNHGQLWKKSPADLDPNSRLKLWEKSQLLEQFDVFFSHTWRTPGRWKFIALLFQYGWPFAMASWFCAVVLVVILGVLGLLPTPFIYRMNILGFEASCPYAPWAYISGSLTMLISLLAFPYCDFAHQSPKCFLDVVSIHQTDPELTMRGVYGLGGFLRVSKEMRVLWSPPYLTRCLHMHNPRAPVT